MKIRRSLPGRLTRSHDDPEPDLHFIGNRIGVFPLAFADVELQAPDGECTFEDARCAVVFVSKGRDDLVSPAFDRQWSTHLEAPAAQWPDAGRDEHGLRKIACIEPQLAFHFIVDFGVVDVEAVEVY